MKLMVFDTQQGNLTAAPFSLSFSVLNSLFAAGFCIVLDAETLDYIMIKTPRMRGRQSESK